MIGKPTSSRELTTQKTSENRFLQVPSMNISKTLDLNVCLIFPAVSMPASPYLPRALPPQLHKYKNFKSTNLSVWEVSRTENQIHHSPRIANCLEGSLGGPRDRFFTMVMVVTEPSQPPVFVDRTVV